MSDLYQETTESADASTSGWDAGHDTQTGHQYEDAEPDHGYRNDIPGETAGYGGDNEYQETSTEVQERITSQDELPTQEQSRAATWGENPDHYDEADLATEHDGDASTYHSWEDDIPSPEESRQATWGDNPQYYDEADLYNEYDEDPDALAATHHDAEGGKDPASAGAEVPDESPDQAPDLGPADRNPAADDSQAAGSERIAELEARIERLEQARNAPDVPLLKNERDVDKIPGRTTEHQSRWRPSDARLNLGAAIVGSGIAEAADFIAGGPAHHVFGIVGSVISIGVAAITASRESRKDKDVRTPEH